MSPAQVTFDDYAIPSPASPQAHELNLGPGISRQSSLYPQGHLDASLPGPRFSGQIPHIPARPPHTFLVQQPDLMAQCQLSGGQSTFINAPYPSNVRRTSPQGFYAAASGWTGRGAYGEYYNPGSSTAFLQNLQSVIDSSHTAQTKQQNAANIAAPAQPSGAAPSSWTGSIDLTTGVFQRSVEHPRLRTAQACERCRARKAKCTGEIRCKRCRVKDFECEYAPERKMRGPNKNRRKAAQPKKRSTASPTSSDRVIPDSASTSTSSDSDSYASCRQRSESSPSTVASYRLDIPSAHSSPAPAHRSSPSTTGAFRARSATVGQNPLRPSHLDIGVARQMYPRLLAEYARGTNQAPYPVLAETGRDSRTFLPTHAHLAEPYSRLALNTNAAPGVGASLESCSVSQAAGNFVHPSPIIAGPSSFPPSTQHSLSNSPEMSATPITPLSLTYDAVGGLVYPNGTPAFDNGLDSFVPSPVSSDNGYLGAVDGMADVLQAKGLDQDGWQAAADAVYAQVCDNEMPRGVVDTLMDELMDDAI